MLKVGCLQVGTGTPLASNASINLIDFTVAPADLGTGTAVVATAGSGDLGKGVVTAKIVSDGGNLTFTSTTTGALGNGAGDTISYGQIDTAVATLTSATALPAPVLADAATTSTTVTAVSKIVNRDARWTYTDKNQNVVPPGTYGGAGINNGRVTYTASVP